MTQSGMAKQQDKPVEFEAFVRAAMATGKPPKAKAKAKKTKQRGKR